MMNIYLIMEKSNEIGTTYEFDHQNPLQRQPRHLFWLL